jgi:glycosyltransferase involved in cell wall biosynthesis
VRTPLGVNERIPVLTFLSNFLIGGTERQVINLVHGLDQARFAVHMACFRRAGPLLEEIDTGAMAFSDYPIATLRSLRTLWQQGRLARYVRAHGIRIVHSFGFYANVFAVPAARLGGAAVVVASIRDTGDHLTWGQRLLQRWVCRAADHVLVNAVAVKTLLVKQGYDGSAISVIGNGIDVSRFHRRGEATAVRQELGLPAGAPVVAVVARLNRLKGIEYFLAAAAILARRFEHVRFLVVGDSVSQAYRDGLEAYAAALGLGERVVFTGFRSDVPELLSVVSVSVLPSLSEGLSNVVLEAMAAGVSVVATSVGGTPEMVDDGVTGLLVPPRDAGALADAIASLLADSDLRRAIGEAGRRRVEERFSLEAMLRATEQLYERLLREARPVNVPTPDEPLREGGCR